MREIIDVAVGMPALQGLKRWVASRPFARSVAVLAGGAAASQVVAVVSTPIITRLYSPSDFGVVTVMASIVSMISVLVTLRYSTAIVVAHDDESGAHLVGLSLIVVAAMATLATLAVLVLGRQIAVWADSPLLDRYLWYLPLGLLGIGIYEVLHRWALRRKAFGRITRTRLHQSIGAALTKMVLGGLGLGPAGLLCGNLIGETGGIGTLAMLAWRRDRPIIRRISISGIRKVARRYYRFPLISSWSALIQGVGLQLPVLLLASLYGSEMIGAFGLAHRLVTIPMALVGDSVSNVYFTEAARLGVDPRKLRRFCLQTGRRLALIGLLPCIAFAAVAPWVFGFVFGPEWREAGTYAQLLSLMVLARFVFTPISRNFAILERQDLLLVWEVFRLALVVAGVKLAGWLGLSPAEAVGLYSAGMVLSYVGLFGLTMFAIGERIRVLGAQRREMDSARADPL